MFAILRGRWRQQARLTRFLFALLISLSTLLGPSGTVLAQPTTAPRAAMPDEAVSPEFRSVLTQYGRFVQHDRFGEVWVPTVTPEGWHPYPPCHWVKTQKYGWYYDDKTPWGQIVHHYGRWFFRSGFGWAWWPGRLHSHAYWSPAFVGFFGFGGFGGGFGRIGWLPLAPFETEAGATLCDLSSPAPSQNRVRPIA